MMTRYVFVWAEKDLEEVFDAQNKKDLVVKLIDLIYTHYKERVQSHELLRFMANKDIHVYDKGYV